MKTILVPSDFSEPALEAYKFAIDLAKTTGMNIVVVHAIHLPIIATGFDIQTYTYSLELTNDLERHARKLFAKLKADYPFDAQPLLEVRFSSVVDAVHDVIAKYDVEIIVMGTQGADGLKEIFIGSNAERMVRFSTVPVIVIRKAPAINSIKSILFPNNLELNQAMLVERVKNLQSFFHAKLHLLWINKPGDFHFDAEVQAKMRDFVQHYKISDYTFDIRNEINEEAGVTNFVREKRPDLIVMGTRGRRGLAHLFAGSVTEDVVNHISCPIWTYSLHK